MKFSANIGFLWYDLPFLERIIAAKAAGFDVVECHFPYDYSKEAIAQTLKEQKMRMLGLNTAPGPEGYFGLGALAGKEPEARRLIDQAIDYGDHLGVQHINVLASLTDGVNGAEAIYRANLAYAAEQAAQHGIIIVIEPLNPRSVPHYHCHRIDMAVETIKAVGAPNLKLMFDFFHAQIVHGDLETLIRDTIDHIAHVQIAAVHDRGEPDEGEINYPYILQVLHDARYQGYIGAEYKPRGGSVEAGLDWMKTYQ